MKNLTPKQAADYLFADQKRFKTVCRMIRTGELKGIWRKGKDAGQYITTEEWCDAWTASQAGRHLQPPNGKRKGSQAATVQDTQEAIANI